MRQTARMRDPLPWLVEAGLLAPDACDAVRRAPLAGGWWNDVQRLRAPGIDWVVKIYAEGGDSTLFPLLPADEARALDVLAGHAIAPDPVAYLARSAERPAVLVYAFHAGTPWDGDVEAVADLLRRQHALAATGFRDVPTDGAGIVQGGASLLADAAPADRARLERARPAGDAPPAARRALLHTDVGPANLIEGATGLRLIDWQCPALGDAAEDVFSFLSPAFQVLSGREPLAAAERERFLAAYGDPAMAARLDLLWRPLSWRMAAYCAARRAALAAVDPAGSARYARALGLCLEEPA